MVPLAPLHQPQALRVIGALQDLRPDMLQTASFDTAFHATQDDLVRRLAIPRSLHDEGLRRYGFHGLSYKFIAGALKRQAPEVTGGKVVAAHLGSGASLCALQNGISRDCSMGFSALDGIPMATRPGSLDPGALLYLMRKGPRDPQRAGTLPLSCLRHAGRLRHQRRIPANHLTDERPKLPRRSTSTASASPARSAACR